MVQEINQFEQKRKGLEAAQAMMMMNLQRANPGKSPTRGAGPQTITEMTQGSPLKMMYAQPASPMKG